MRRARRWQFLFTAPTAAGWQLKTWYEVDMMSRAHRGMSFNSFPVSCEIKIAFGGGVKPADVSTYARHLVICCSLCVRPNSLSRTIKEKPPGGDTTSFSFAASFEGWGEGIHIEGQSPRAQSFRELINSCFIARRCGFNLFGERN